MDSGSGRSGGKILKQKRIAARNTPYDRPTQSQQPPQPEEEEKPGWLTGLVSPAKFVAGGASKIISSIWNPNTWSARSSDTDAESDDESGDEETPLDGVVELSEQKPYQKSELLHYIEQLLLFEHFTREECDRLIEIINSRVVDNSNGAGPSMIHSSTNNETSDIHNQAILEAKKWVAENKVRSGLRSDLDNGIFALKSVMTPQATEKETGSPVDVAKSYMKSRPPWASPINNDKLLTPSPLAADLFKERTPFSSTGGLSFSSAKKDYLSAGSWNIQEELRRVRTKATEDLLNSQRSAKLALSANETSIIAAGRTELFKSVDEVVNLAAEDMMTSQNNLATEALHSHPAMPNLEQYQGINQNGLEKEQGTTQPDDRNLGHENNSSAKDMAQADNNCFFMTESPDIPTVSNSQDSFNNTNDQSQTPKKKYDITENQAVTRASRSTRRAKARGK